MSARVQRHTDHVVYVVWVLWVIGMSETGIAAATGKRRKQVAGIVTRSPYANRSAMDRATRQAKLDELLSVRLGDDGNPIDRGLLDRIPLTLIDLQGRQQKRRKG